MLRFIHYRQQVYDLLAFFIVRGIFMQQDTFLEGRILPPLIKFSLPLMLSLILQALYGGVDLAVVGKFSETSSVSAVATGSQVMQTATVIVTGLTMGVTVLLGQATGAGDKKRAEGVAAGQIKLFTFAAVLLTAVMELFARRAAIIMNVPSEALEETVKYIQICSGGMVFITAYNAISGVFRGIGNSRSPFIFVSIACVANIIGDLILVGVFDMGASGAAYATVMAQAVSVAFSAFYIRRIGLPFSLTSDGFKQKGTVKAIVKIGAPIALQDFLVGISFLIITSIINTLGLTASASVGVSEKIYAFLSIVPMAFMSALSAFVAQNIGAGNPKRAVQSLFIAQRISFCFGVAMFIGTFFFGAEMTSLFADDPAVIETTAQYLKGCSFEYLIITLAFCMLGYFNGIGKTTFVMFQGLLSSFLVRIPLSYMLSRMPGTSMALISIAVPISALTELVLSIIYFIYLRKKGISA